MAVLNFNYGLVKDLPAYQEGHLYITTDSQGLYVDLDGTRTHVSDFIQVATQEELTALGTYYTQVFYYVEGSNALLKYTGIEGNEWKQLNSTSALSQAITDLTARVAKNETDIASLKTADQQINKRIDELDAEDIEIIDDIVVTTPVGNFTKGQRIPANTDLQALLIEMLSQDVNPTTSYPSHSISLSGAGAKEVGSTFYPSYTVSTDPGLYSANGEDQATNVTFSDFVVTEGTRPDSAASATKTTDTGSFTHFVVTDTTNYNVKASVKHSAGDMPKTFLGKDYPAGQIEADTLDDVASSSVTGYRPMFYGMTANTNALDSAAIRGLTNSNGKPGAKTITLKAADLAGVKRFIVAIPASSTVKLKKAIITSSQNADATADYVLQDTQVNVEGASGYAITKPYKVWIYEPASIASVEVHEITLGT